MDIAGISSPSAALAQGSVAETVGNAMLRKALDIQMQSAQQLLEALPQVASNPPHLGNSIDVKA